MAEERYEASSAPLSSTGIERRASERADESLEADRQLYRTAVDADYYYFCLLLQLDARSCLCWGCFCSFCLFSLLFALLLQRGENIEILLRSLSEGDLFPFCVGVLRGNVRPPRYQLQLPPPTRVLQ